jgi:hypothetical protein
MNFTKGSLEDVKLFIINRNLRGLHIRMGFVLSFSMAFLLVRAPPCCGQDKTDCRLLNADENEKAVAAALGICSAVERVEGQQLSAEERLAIQDRLQPGLSLGKERPSTDLSAKELQAVEDRQQISVAATLAIRDVDVMLLRVESNVIEDEEKQWLAEKKAYRRTKIINSFLGTGVSAVGTGLQLSGSLKVQQAGDIVGVIGGVITAVFNICTADINVQDSPPNLPLGENGCLSHSGPGNGEKFKMIFGVIFKVTIIS